MKTGLFSGGSYTRKWEHLGLSAQRELLGTAEPSARGGALICHWVSCSGLWKVPWSVRGWQRTKTGQGKRRLGAVELALSGPVSPNTKSKSWNLGENIRTMDGLLQNIQILSRED